MSDYLSAFMDPWVTMREGQKLMYFMQAAGECLGLNYAKSLNGPYAQNLPSVLGDMDECFTGGYSEPGSHLEANLKLNFQTVEQGKRVLLQNEATLERYRRVAKLIEGFEQVSNVELLAMVHWVAIREQATTLEQSTEKVQAWDRQKRRFEPYHIQVAWKHLQHKGWIG